MSIELDRHVDLIDEHSVRLPASTQPGAAGNIAGKIAETPCRTDAKELDESGTVDATRNVLPGLGESR